MFTSVVVVDHNLVDLKEEEFAIEIQEQTVAALIRRHRTLHFFSPLLLSILVLNLSSLVFPREKRKRRVRLANA